MFRAIGLAVRLPPAEQKSSERLRMVADRPLASSCLSRTSGSSPVSRNVLGLELTFSMATPQAPPSALSHCAEQKSV